MLSPLHHQSIRKRKSIKNTSRLIYWFDRIIIVAGILTVVATIPQVLEIWLNGTADGVSSISWGYYTFYSALFTVYGIIHKEFPIIFNYSTITVLDAMVLVGTLIY